MTHAPATSNPEKPRRPGAPKDPHAFQEPHVPLRVYYMVFVALMFFMVLTIAAAFLPHHTLGTWSTIIALAIATTKAVLVVLYFMHVKYSTRLTWVVVVASFLWLGVLFVLTFADYLTRGWLMK